MHDLHLLPSSVIKYASGIGANDLYAGGRWYAVNSQPSSEQCARLNLERQGWQCFYPVYETSVRIGGRVADRNRSRFSGYLFRKMVADHYRWREIDSTYGARSVLKHGNLPIPSPLAGLRR